MHEDAKNYMTRALADPSMFIDRSDKMHGDTKDPVTRALADPEKCTIVAIPAIRRKLAIPYSGLYQGESRRIRV